LDYSIGFSLKGLIVFLLTMIPNLFYFWLPKTVDRMTNVKKHPVLDMVEHGCQGIFILLLIFLVSGKASPVLSPYTPLLGIILILYFILWFYFFTGRKILPILLGLAILPVIYFILAEIWLHNFPAVIPTAIFGLTHVIITYLDVD
jgi:hypothetical protein